MIERAGQLLFGVDDYRQKLARALDVDERMLRRWIAGTRDMPPDLYGRLYLMLAERRAAIAALQHELMSALYPEERTP